MQANGGSRWSAIILCMSSITRGLDRRPIHRVKHSARKAHRLYDINWNFLPKQDGKCAAGRPHSKRPKMVVPGQTEECRNRYDDQHYGRPESPIKPYFHML